MELIKRNKWLIATTLVAVTGIYYGAVLANKIIRNTTVDMYICMNGSRRGGHRNEQT